MKQITPLFILFVILAATGYLFNIKNNQLKNQLTIDSNPMPTADCIPTFLDGGGPYYQQNSPFREQISPDENDGTKLVVSGKVLNSDCSSSIGNLIVDVWQANESGNYEDEWYRGRVYTTADGTYSFTTVIPKGYGEGTAFRPPHIHFKIWNENIEIITSQMFLPESRNQGIEEAYIIDITQLDDGSFIGTHDIILP